MPLYTADALILRTYKLGEADRIVVFLTSDRGKRRGVARGARRTRSRFSGGLEVFTQAKVAYVERENRDLVRLNYVEPVQSPLVSANADVLEHAGYFAELVDEWALEGDPSERIFRLGASVITTLAAGASVGPVARYFEYWLLRLQGVYPSVTNCQQCGASLLERGAQVTAPYGVCVCPDCGSLDGGASLSPEAIAFLRSAATRSPSEMGDVRLGRRAARELTATHRLLISANLQKELRSVRVMRELQTIQDGQ